MDIAALFEMDWYDRSPLTDVLRRNVGRWIHFSKGAPNRDWQQAKLLPEPQKPDSYSPRTAKRYQRDLAAVKRKNAIHPVPKLGINPRSMWQDPKGIYFYPVGFLLSGAERITSGNQYGLDNPYYYIVDLNLNDPNGINLGTMTWSDVETIARRNGWINQMQEFRQLPPEEQKEKLFSYSRPDLPGSFFWHFIDRMVKDGQMRWTTAYKGVSYIRDPNLSIIHNNEPDQVLVLDPRIIKIVEFGENKNPIKAGSGQDSLQQWWHALFTLIKRVRGEYGGDLTWKDKRPTLSFSKGVGRFQLAISQRSVFGEVGLALSYTYGRAEDGLHIDYKDLLNSSIEQIVAKIRDRVERVAARKTDLLFKPIIDIDTAKRLMIEQMADHLGSSISTRISNADNPEHSRYNSVYLYGEVQREINRVMFKTICHLHLKDAGMSATCNLHVGPHHLIYAPSPVGEDYTDPTPMFEAMATKARDNLSNMLTQFGPRPPGRNSYYDRHARFDSQELVTAFNGWLILNSGLSLDGLLIKEFTNEIAAFNEYPEKRALLADIAYVMNSKW